MPQASGTSKESHGCSKAPIAACFMHKALSGTTCAVVTAVCPYRTRGNASFSNGKMSFLASRVSKQHRPMHKVSTSLSRLLKLLCNSLLSQQNLPQQLQDLECLPMTLKIVSCFSCCSTFAVYSCYGRRCLYCRHTYCLHTKLLATLLMPWQH